MTRQVACRPCAGSITLTGQPTGKLCKRGKRLRGKAEIIELSDASGVCEGEFLHG